MEKMGKLVSLQSSVQEEEEEEKDAAMNKNILRVHIVFIVF